MRKLAELTKSGLFPLNLFVINLVLTTCSTLCVREKLVIYCAFLRPVFFCQDVAVNHLQIYLCIFSFLPIGVFFRLGNIDWIQDVYCLFCGNNSVTDWYFGSCIFVSAGTHWAHSLCSHSLNMSLFTESVRCAVKVDHKMN